MFDIGWSEMAVIMLVALVVIGPKDLPRLARTVGQWVAKGRAMAREFQRSLEDMAREAELDDVKRQIEKVGRTDIKKSIEKTIDPTGDLGRAFNPNPSLSSRNTPAKPSAAAPNGEAPNSEAKQATAKPEATGEAGKTAKAETTAKPSTASPKPRVKAKAATEPKASTKTRTSAKPRTTKTGTGPKPASSETGEPETVAGPR